MSSQISQTKPSNRGRSLHHPDDIERDSCYYSLLSLLHNEIVLSIRQHRDDVNLTQRELAELSGMRPEQLNRFLHNPSNAKLRTFTKILTALGYRGFKNIESYKTGITADGVSIENRINIAASRNPISASKFSASASCSAGTINLTSYNNLQIRMSA